MTARTTLRAIVAAVLLSAVPALAAAHVHLESSTPSAGENLDQPPTEVTIEFDGELDPERSAFTVTDEDGGVVGSGEVDLDVADRNILAGEVTISQPGIYRVAYSVLGTDGHEVAGEFHFGFDAQEEVPNTALGGQRVQDRQPLSAVGLLLLALGALAAVRRVAMQKA
jgi:methionine-rich copper-binding protein CopC